MKKDTRTRPCTHSHILGNMRRRIQKSYYLLCCFLLIYSNSNSSNSSCLVSSFTFTNVLTSLPSEFAASSNASSSNTSSTTLSSSKLISSSSSSKPLPSSSLVLPGVQNPTNPSTHARSARSDSHLKSQDEDSDAAADLTENNENENNKNENETTKCNDESNNMKISSTKTSTKTSATSATSKRQMLKFALPALGIFLSSPLLSNIDNAFVGKTAGTAGLAALSPATICTDQMIYLFSFLSRATTGIVSRAYSDTSVNVNVDTSVNTSVDTSVNAGTSDNDNNDNSKQIEAARQAASTPLTMALLCGILLSILYTFLTPTMLKTLNVNPTLHNQASKYIYWRGCISWATLVQNVSLSIMLATKDALSPLRIISIAAIVNVICDALLCVYPFQLGCEGAGAATSFATLFSSYFMIRHLHTKKLLPIIPPMKMSLSSLSTALSTLLPKRKDVKELFDYVGPLFAITISRLIGFMSMQKAAMKIGLHSLASYQICINSLIFFLLFGEPLSQLHQTKLPSLIDDHDYENVVSTIKSVLVLSSYTAISVSLMSYMTLTYGGGFFTSDPVVLKIIQETAPSVAIAVGSTIIGTTIDGAMLASRDFSFILCLGICTCIMQVYLSSRCLTLSSIFLSFALRLVTYSISAIGRVTVCHSGALGKLLMVGRERRRRGRRVVRKEENEECEGGREEDGLCASSVV